MSMRSKYLRWLLTFLLFLGVYLYFSIFFSIKINISNADLGRHIVNGYNILNGNASKVLYTDFHSYTYPDNPHINHHYLAGVIYYVLYSSGGFTMVSVYNALLSALFVFLLFLYGYKKVGFLVSFGLMVLLMPIIAYRTEVRPEMYSYLFFTIFTLVLHETKGRLTYKHFGLLFVIQALWVNLHAYFVLSFFATGAFLFAAILSKDKTAIKSLTILIVVQLVASLVSPFGPKVLLAPFEVINGLGVKSGENYPLFIKPATRLAYIAYVLLGLLTTFVVLVVSKSKNRLGISFLTILFALGAFYMIRLVSIYAICLYVCLIFYVQQIPRSYYSRYTKKIALAIVVIAFCMFTIPFNKGFGYGLLDGSDDASEFVLRNKIKGPVFNDFNVGGNLAFYLSKDFGTDSQGKKVYVHNVPEALPKEFLSDWNKNYYLGKFQKNALERYDFNYIFVATSKMPPNFILSRLHDKDWVPVYYDEFAMIFVRNNSQNAELIAKFKLSDSAKEWIVRTNVDDYTSCKLAGFRVEQKICKTCTTVCYTPWGDMYEKGKKYTK